MKQMKKRRRLRLKINDDTMSSIVIYSLGFCVAVVVAGFVFLCFDKDASAIISSALTVFGTELGICGLMKIYERKIAAEDRRADERRKRRAEKTEKAACLNDTKE